MKAPKCRLCHHEHGHSEPHQWEGWNGVVEPRMVTPINNAPVLDDPRIGELMERMQALEAQVAELREQVREQNVNSEVNEVHADVHANVNDVHADRAAYQREYMKKWRAERKAKQ